MPSVISLSLPEDVFSPSLYFHSIKPLCESPTLGRREVSVKKRRSPNRIIKITMIKKHKTLTRIVSRLDFLRWIYMKFKIHTSIRHDTLLGSYQGSISSRIDKWKCTKGIRVSYSSCALFRIIYTVYSGQLHHRVGSSLCSGGDIYIRCLLSSLRRHCAMERRLSFIKL